MNLNDILNLDINNLKEQQYNALKEHTINKLKEIINLLEKDKLQEIQNKLAYSPAGDGWGEDNYYINFTFKENEFYDLSEIIYFLADLKNIDIEVN